MASFVSNLSDAVSRVFPKCGRDMIRLKKVIYIDFSGCQWRMLPAEYPKWQTVYYYFRRRGAMDAFSELNYNLVQKIRLKNGESAASTIGAIDSASACPGHPRSQKGIDGNKKLKGVKHNIITDKGW